MSEQQLSELSFTSLHLPESLARGIADAGFERCTPIQARSLPRALAGLDVAGQAQTGTGKTAAFLVALYSRLLRSDPDAGRPVTSPRALVLAPTRELAVQRSNPASAMPRASGSGSWRLVKDSSENCCSLTSALLETRSLEKWRATGYKVIQAPRVHRKHSLEAGRSRMVQRDPGRAGTLDRQP